MEHAILHLLTLVVVGVLSLVFRSKVSPPNAIQRMRLEELKPTFKKFDTIVGLSSVLIGWPALTLVFASLLWVIFFFFDSVPEGTLFYFSAIYGDKGKFEVALSIGVLLAIGFSVAVIIYFLRNKYAQDFDLYLFWSFDVIRINLIAFSRAWMAFFSAIALILLVLIDDWHVKIDTTSIELNRFMSLKEEKYLLKDIRKLEFSPLTKAPNGDLVEQERYRILFRNGKYWVFDEWLSGNAGKDSTMMWLEKQTHLKITNKPISDW
jgi:hypothetical protein